MIEVYPFILLASVRPQPEATHNADSFKVKLGSGKSIGETYFPSNDTLSVNLIKAISKISLLESHFSWIKILKKKQKF
jgi:hypothetical protein